MSSKNAAKISIFCAALAVLVWLWESEAAMEAVVLFATAGVVPGTGVVLTPEQMYLVLGVILLVVFLLLLRNAMTRGAQHMRIFWRGGRAAVRAYRQVAYQDAGTTHPRMTLSVSALAIKHTDVTQQTVKPAEAIAVFPEYTGNETDDPATKPAVVITIPAGPGHVMRAWEHVRPRLFIMAANMLEYMLRGMHVLDRWMRRGLDITRDYTGRAWCWAEPRIRTFDKQIERALKGNKHTATALRAVDASVKSATVYSALLRAKMGRRFSRTPEE